MKPVFLGQIDISELFSVKDGSQYDSDCLELNGLEYEYRLAIVNDGKKTFSVECFENTYFKQVLRIRQRVEMSIRENIIMSEQELNGYLEMDDFLSKWR